MSKLHSQAFALRQKYAQDPNGLALHLSKISLTHPGLAEEVFSGLDDHTASIVRQTFFSHLSPAAIRLAGFNNSRVMMWPPTTHDEIIDEAFNDLKPAYQEAIHTGSRRVDHESLTVPTLIEENAPQHAMTPAKKVKELGSVEKAQEWARAEAKKFVKSKIALARTNYLKSVEASKDGQHYWLILAYERLGEALHTIMDNWSPAHTGFQVYDGSELPKGAAKGAVIGGVIAGPPGAIVGAVIGGYRTTTEHSKIEARLPTRDEMDAMIDEMRLAFIDVFEKTRGAVSEAQMYETIARLKKRGNDGMLSQ